MTLAPFQTLTERGRPRRLRRLALAALERYDIAVARLTPVSWHLNVLFRVETPSGERYALRISHPSWRDDVELASEVAWLADLAGDPEIAAHHPIANRDSEFVTVVAVPGVPEPRRVVLFSWAPGARLVQRLTDANVAALGVLSARLHERALAFQPPATFTTRRLDLLFPRDEPLVLVAPERAQAELNRLYAGPEPPRVVHGDLRHENVLVDRGRLQPINFEDVIWAYPIQDIALTFYDFRYDADPARHDYAALRAAFQRGIIVTPLAAGVPRTDRDPPPRPAPLRRQLGPAPRAARTPRPVH